MFYCCCKSARKNLISLEGTERVQLFKLNCKSLFIQIVKLNYKTVDKPPKKKHSNFVCHQFLFETSCNEWERDWGKFNQPLPLDFFLSTNSGECKINKLNFKLMLKAKWIHIDKWWLINELKHFSNDVNCQAVDNLRKCRNNNRSSEKSTASSHIKKNWHRWKRFIFS